jgi:hypothetical protein
MRGNDHDGGVMTPAEQQTLQVARQCGVGRRAQFSRHVREERFSDRSLGAEDLFCALANARLCRSEGLGKHGVPKWRVFGPSLDGDELQLIVEFDPHGYVITVFGAD